MKLKGENTIRLIDAQKFKKQVAGEIFIAAIPIEKGGALMKLIDLQPTMIEGEVKEAEFAYQRTVKVKPNKHDYGYGYYKYSCPVCDAVDNPHQVTVDDDDCPLCNVSLQWKNN